MYRRAIFRSRTLVAGVLAVSAATAVASAADKVRVQILAIRATTSNTKISPELKSLASKLKKDFKYTGYTLEKKTGGTIEVGKSKSYSLVGRYSAVVQATAKGSKIKIKFELREKSGKTSKTKLSTTLSLKPGKSQILGRWSLGKGDVLILAVSAK